MIPPTNLATIIGNIISGLKPAVNPKWSPNTKEADTAKATFIIFPLSSMSFNIPYIGILFAKLAIIPAAAISLIPNIFPSPIKGFLNTLVII